MGIFDVPKGKLQIPGFGKALDQLMGGQTMQIVMTNGINCKLSQEEALQKERVLREKIINFCEEIGLKVELMVIDSCIRTLINNHQRWQMTEEELKEFLNFFDTPYRRQTKQHQPKLSVDPIEGFRCGMGGRLPPDY